MPPRMRYRIPMTMRERFHDDEALPMARQRLAISITYCVP